MNGAVLFLSIRRRQTKLRGGWKMPFSHFCRRLCLISSFCRRLCRISSTGFPLLQARAAGESPRKCENQESTPMKKDASGRDIGVEGGQEATGPDRRKRRSSGGEYPCRGHPIPRRFLQPQPVRAGSSFRFRVPLPARNQQASFLRRGVPCVWTPYSPPVFIRSKQGLRVGAVASQEAIEPDRGEACGSRNRGGRRPGSCLTAPTEESPPPVKRVVRDAGYKPALLASV